MTKAELIRTIAAQTGFTQADTREILEHLRGLAVSELRSGRDFLLPGWAKFSVVERKRRIGRNIRTGESVEIPARNVVRCRVARPFQTDCCD